MTAMMSYDKKTHKTHFHTFSMIKACLPNPITSCRSQMVKERVPHENCTRKTDMVIALSLAIKSRR